jgi:hypothetical protein
VFFKDGSAKVMQFNNDGADVGEIVIFEPSDRPLNTLLRALYNSGSCNPNVQR